MMIGLRAFWLIVVVIVNDGFAFLAWAETPPQPRQLRVNGVDLSYIEQGTGAAVLFVHGAWMDLRYWEPQRQAVAKQHRFIAYNYRYHGTAPWPDDGKRYSAVTHATDLATLIRRLNAGPVHLVGLSSGALIATLVASEHPELVRSLTLAEPPIGALLADIPEGKPVLDDRSKALAPILTAKKAGNAVQATKLFFEWVNTRCWCLRQATRGLSSDNPG